MVKTNFEKTFMEKDPFSDVLGQSTTKHQAKSALVVGRHIIISGPPGVGKTTFARNIAKLLPEVSANDCEFNCDPKNPVCPRCLAKKTKGTGKIKGEERFVRIQGSPDLTVEDLLGDIDPIKALKYGPLSIEAFAPGKIFKANNGILFFDEVNRCPEKLQNALLQVLQEGNATIGSYTVDLPANFIFIGTMNPEDTSTERLSDVFIDRFDVINMDYPESLDVEKEIVLSKGKKLDVKFPDNLLRLAVLFVRILRENKDLEKKPSVRASIGLYERAQANAFLAKRKTVSPEDISNAVISVLSHRIELKPSVKYLESAEDFLKKELREFTEEHKEFEQGGDG